MRPLAVRFARHLLDGPLVIVLVTSLSLVILFEALSGVDCDEVICGLLDRISSLMETL